MKREVICKKIKNSMPDNLNELEIAAYINLEMAKLKDFSEKYYWGTNSERNKIYKLAKIDNRNSMQEKRQIICVTSCKLYEYLCDEFGIDTYYQGDKGNKTKNDLSVFENGEHIFSIVKLKDGRHIKVDSEWELESIKTRFKMVKIWHKGRT